MAASRSASPDPSDAVTYDVVVVGGGVSGIVSATLVAEALASSSSSAAAHTRGLGRVILLEAADDLGGCVRDATWCKELGFRRCAVVEGKVAGEERAPSNVVPLGAVEINPTQGRVLALCKQFGVECDCVRYTDCAIVNGTRCYVDDDQIQGFPANREEGEKFRFVGDFESTDEIRYREFCTQEVFDAYNYYPKRGLSELLCSIVDHGRSFGNLELRVAAPVHRLHYLPDADGEARYVVVARDQPLIRCRRVVLAVPPHALSFIEGPVSAALLRQPFVYDSKGIPVTTVTMWFDTLWWKDASFQRIWSKYNPLLHVELFGSESQRTAKAIRASFADGSASERWRGEASRSNGQPSAEATAEMIAALQVFFPNVKVPQPAFVHVAYFPSAWHFEHLQAPVDLWTKQRLAMDLTQLNAIDPEAATAIGPGVHLVGEAYNPQRVWVQGAIESVMLSLMPVFVPDASTRGCYLGNELPSLTPPKAVGLTPDKVLSGPRDGSPAHYGTSSMGGLHDLDPEVPPDRVSSPPPAATLERLEHSRAEVVRCEFLVVGGGIAGLSSAAMLLEADDSREVVVLEAFTDVGGCIRDVTWSPGYGFAPVRCAEGMSASIAGAAVVPAGAIRIPPTHDALVRLAKSVGIRWHEATYRNCAVINGQRRLIDSDKDGEVLFACPVYPETAEDLQAMRFVGDFESVDRARYAEFASEDTAGDTNFYPIGGLSEITRRLVDIIREDGGAIRCSTTVCSAEYVPGPQGYYRVLARSGTAGEGKVLTEYRCQHLVLAVPPRKLFGMSGGVPQFLCAQPFIRESKPIRATTVAMWFRTRWWSHLPFHRIWDRHSPLIHVELFNDPAKCGSHAIRVSFADGSAFDTFGSPQRRSRGLLTTEQAAARATHSEDGQGKKGSDDSAPAARTPPHQPETQMDGEGEVAANTGVTPPVNPDVVRRIVDALRAMFPDCDVELPLHTHMELFGSAWHFEHSNAQTDIFAKQELAMDLQKRLKAPESVVGPSCYLVGEAYNPQRAWINAALESVQLALMPTFVLPLVDADNGLSATVPNNRGDSQRGRGRGRSRPPRFLLGTSLPEIKKVSS